MHDLFVSGVLKSSFAKHKFLLLLGPRWRPADSALVQRLNDALVSGAEALESLYASEPLGEFKIASSDLPHQSQNMKMVQRCIGQNDCGVKQGANLCGRAAGRAPVYLVDFPWRAN